MAAQDITGKALRDMYLELAQDLRETTAGGLAVQLEENLLEPLGHVCEALCCEENEDMATFSTSMNEQLASCMDTTD